MGEGKVIKYLLYAIGEIILVVIGILIAVQIDDYYTQKEKEAQVDEIIVQIGKQLIRDIDYINSYIEFYSEKDSLINLVLNKELDSTDYENNPFLFNIISNWEPHIILNDKYYSNLLILSPFIPIEEKPVLSQLETVYGSARNDFIEINSSMGRRVTMYVEYLADEHPFFSDPSLKKERLDFYLNSPTYLSKVKMFQMINSDFIRYESIYLVQAYKALSLIRKETLSETILKDSPAKNYEQLNYQNCEVIIDEVPRPEDKRVINIYVVNELNLPITLHFVDRKDSNKVKPSGIGTLESNSVSNVKIVAKLQHYFVQDEKGKCLGQFQVGEKNCVVVIK